MKRVGYLFERITSFENLMKAAKKSMRGKRHKRSAATFFFRMENDVIRISQELESGTYKPGPYDQFEIREPKVRKICSSTFRDRVVHHAVCNVIEPYIERRLIADTYACRPGMGTHKALHRAQHYTKRYRYFLKCDIRKYFESVDHGVLKALFRRLFKDAKLLLLLDQIVDHAVPGAEPGKGIPIGNLTSQHFANLYLGELDRHVTGVFGVGGYVRYMDDFIIFDNSKERLHEVLREVRCFLGQALKLILKEKVVRIAPVSEGVPFLGFRVFPHVTRLQRSGLVRFRRNIQRQQRMFAQGLISADDMVRSVHSMIAHVSHADTTMVRRDVFERMA